MTHSPSSPFAFRINSLLAGALILLAILACSAAFADAQRGPGGQGGQGGPGGGPGGVAAGSFSRDAGNSPSQAAQSYGSNSAGSAVGGGLQLGPPGRWWDDKQFARSIGLDTKQQQKIDEVFEASKGTLLKLYKNLKHEESDLDKMIRVRTPDESQIFQQIDRVVQARGELEKANAHMLLQIRSQLTTAQISRLEQNRP